MDIYDLNIYEGRLRYAGRVPKNRSFEKKIGRKSKIFSRFFRSLKKNRAKKMVILEINEKSAQMGGYNPPKRGYNPPL